MAGGSTRSRGVSADGAETRSYHNRPTRFPTMGSQPTLSAHGGRRPRPHVRFRPFKGDSNAATIRRFADRHPLNGPKNSSDLNTTPEAAAGRPRACLVILD